MDVYVSTYGRVLTVVTAAAGALGVGGVVSGGDLRTSVLAVAIAGFVVGMSWALFWRPRVILDDGGVTVVNVVRTIQVPWPLVVDAEAGWSLVLSTPRHRWTAWAAPRASGTQQTLSQAARRGRPPAEPSRASAEVVAAAIRRRQDELVASGALDGARRAAEEQGVTETVTWHRGTIAGALALVTLVGVAATL
ncbi:PH domain-containing protein [Actinotalea sp. M2MS4P-6]|uniref:PH domain-containing protein n=1 Tax=Actinotalea sp. M2MS4P-6 TaxID=2983762 RepID=UPI0021E35F1C|nr:PH domain-containing protein [Actinotalea sp. M2MS4P-6]MCV2396414.1 PH domain-containing protein [Actinotalea sp. M2MS4P-6]